jgi:tetratricopeptide (TPR) repeat protein
MLRNKITVFLVLFITAGFGAPAAVLSASDRSKQYDTFISLGDSALKENQYASAIEYFQKAKTLFRKREQAYIRLAGAYERSELFELSKQEFLTLLKFRKKSYDANFGLGLVYLHQGMNSQAMEYFRNALTIRHSPEVYRDIAVCEENFGNTELALAMLKQVIAEERSYDDYVNLGRLSEDQKKFRDAEEFYSKSINMDPGRSEGYIYLALFYLAQNSATASEKLLEIAAEKSPEEAIIHFLLADIYSKQGNLGVARLEIEKTGKLAKTQMLRNYSEKFGKIIQLPGSETKTLIRQPQ